MLILGKTLYMMVEEIINMTFNKLILILPDTIWASIKIIFQVTEKKQI